MHRWVLRCIVQDDTDSAERAMKDLLSGRSVWRTTARGAATTRRVLGQHAHDPNEHQWASSASLSRRTERTNATARTQVRHARPGVEENEGEGSNEGEEREVSYTKVSFCETGRNTTRRRPANTESAVSPPHHAPSGMLEIASAERHRLPSKGRVYRTLSGKKNTHFSQADIRPRAHCPQLQTRRLTKAPTKNTRKNDKAERRHPDTGSQRRASQWNAY
jgi:hypothetical protein